jgi:streptogramin lyase
VFPFASAGSPWQITGGPDGNVWFTELDGGRLGRITPQGIFTEFPTRPSAGPQGVQTDRITAGPDGNLWFTELWFAEPTGNPEMVHSRIGRMTPAGAVTRFIPGAAEGAGVNALTAGPDGNVWFTVSEPDRIGRITPAGVVTLFSRGITRGGSPRDITGGADGNLWFTETGGRRIGRITPMGLVTEFPATPTIGAVRLRGTSRVIVPLRCPPAAPASCRGTLRLERGRSRFGVRRYRLAPGHRAAVAVPLWAAGRRQLRSLGRLPLTVRVVWRPHSPLGSVERYVILRLPRLTAVAG